MQVGSDRLADELACIKQHQQRHSALVRVLDAAWLRACSTSHSRVPEEEFLLGPASLLPPSSNNARDLAGLQSNRQASRSAWDGAQQSPPQRNLHVSNTAAQRRLHLNLERCCPHVSLDAC